MRTTTSATDTVAPAEQREPGASPPDGATLEPPREGTDGRRSRRSFFFFGALAAASLLPRKPTPPPPIDAPPPEPGESVAPFAEWDATGVSRLVRRVTMGVTPADMAKANQL